MHARTWIVGPWQDLVLFLATPLLILPAVVGAQTAFTSDQIRWFVMAFGAMGHHLPGMLRAYGDRALFRRFKTRFVLSPIVLVGLCLVSVWRGSQAMVFVAYVWGVWHAFMQAYGFVRIYDAKVGAHAPANARADFAMCAAWFVGGVVFSDMRVHYIQDIAVSLGLPVVGAEALLIVRWIMAVVLGIVTIAYLANSVAQGRRGHGVNPIKHLLVATSVAWWWYANVAVADILIGLILFEIFHDVQYLAIVWLFNRRRVETDTSVGGFTRFLFRRSSGLLFLYLAFVFAYGGLGPVAEFTLSSDTGIEVAKALIVASTLLHFYFDGFIWKVREDSTRAALGIEDQGRDNLVVPWHGFKWLLLVVPVPVFWFMSQAAESASIPQSEALAKATPGAAAAQLKLGVAYAQAGRFEPAVAAFERARQILPQDENARMSLALARVELGKEALRAGDEDAARRHLRAAAADLDGLAAMIHDEGYAMWKRGEHADAILQYRAALVLQPDTAVCHLNLALAYRDAGKPVDGLRHARRGAQLMPGNARAMELVKQLEARQK